MNILENRTIAFSSLLAKTGTFKTDHGKRLFCDAKPDVFNNDNQNAIIYDEQGNTVGTISCDIVLNIQRDEKGRYFVELKDLGNSLKLFPYVEIDILL